MSSTIKPESLSDGARLRVLALSQLRVGSLGFGGPLATMAMMGNELCDRLGLVPRRRFQEGMALVKLMPGPVSSLLAIFLGQEVAGTWGGLLSVFCFVLPSFLMLLLIAYFEQALGPWLRESRAFHFTLDLLQASVLAVIAFTCAKLFRDAHRAVVEDGGGRFTAAGFALLAVALALLLRLPEPAIIATVGVGGWLWTWWRRPRAGLALDPVTVFVAFFVAGTTVFGTGYMVLPFLHRSLVEGHGWLSAQDFSSAVVYGNLTPGPIVIASTYMGFKMGGLGGSLAASIGIFAGPTLLMLFLGPWVRRYLGRSWLKGVLMGILPAVAATILVSLPTLGANLAWTWLQIFVALGALGLSLRGWPIWKVFASVAVLGAGISILPSAHASEATPAASPSSAASPAPVVELPSTIAPEKRIADCGAGGRMEVKKRPYKLNGKESEIFEQRCFKGMNPHGPTKRWYASGQIFNDHRYDQGDPDGVWQSFYPNGKPMLHAEFKAETQDGKKVRMIRGLKSLYADGTKACEYDGVFGVAEQRAKSKIYSQGGKSLEAGQYFALCGGDPQAIAQSLCEQQGHCEALVLIKEQKALADRPKVATPPRIAPRKRSRSSF